MRKKQLTFNLAELTEQKLIQMLNDNDAGPSELFGLLEGLFEMWSSALRFSATVVEYGQERNENFLEIFIQNVGPMHGIPPERLATVLDVLKNRPSAVIH